MASLWGPWTEPHTSRPCASKAVLREIHGGGLENTNEQLDVEGASTEQSSATVQTYCLYCMEYMQHCQAQVLYWG
jgi:hypothetical protein